MAPRKRGAPGDGPRLSRQSGRDAVIAWLESPDGCGLPSDVVLKLNQTWEANNELVDGGTLLDADIELLTDIGVSRTVARKIVQRVQQLAGPATQELAPTTQQHHQAGDEEEDEQMEEDQGEQERQQQARGPREPPRRPPATQPTQLTATQGTRHPPEAPEGSRAARAAAAARPSRATRRASEAPEASQATQGTRATRAASRGTFRTARTDLATQATQSPLIKPDPEQAEEEALAWEEEQQEEQQQQQRRTRRRLSARQQKQEPLEDGREEEMEEAQQEEGMETEAEEESETQDESGGAAPRRRGRHVLKEDPEQLDGGGGAAGVAVQEHSLPLTGRRSARTAGRQQDEQQQEQQQEEAGPSGSGRPRTRRQQQQQEEAQLRATQRELRGRTMQERQRRQEEEQESEEEEEAGGIQQQADAEDEEDWGELAVEDLGPEARSGQYAKDWERRAKWGMLEIFTSMPVQKLRELVEGQEEWSELAANIMRVRRKVEGESTWVELEKAKSIAPRLVNFIMTGDPDGKANDSGPLHQRAIKELLKDYCDDAVRAYVEDVLKPRYQNVPRSQDPHKLMWKLWHYPRGPANDVLETLLGSRELEYEAILGADLEPNAATGNTAWPKVWQAIEAGKLTLVNQEEVLLWLIHVNDLSTHPRVRVSARLTRQPGNRKLRVSIYQIFSTSTLSSSLISGTWQRKNADTEEDELVAVDLRFLLSMLDGFDGSPFMEQMDRLTQEYEATENEVTARGVEGELSVDAPMNLKQFDKVMACVEDVDRGEPAEFREECSDAFLLTLRPYQRRSLAHMLREERALGGSSRNLWVKLNLPEHPDVQCYVSPILHQIRSSTSRIEAEQWVNANGGAGWIALEMGMGKTACAVGAIQMNPPPKGWRKNRAYQTLRARDHLSSVTNNMPHGGTLVVMPPTLIDQWEQEIHKTTDQELSILKWTENKGRQLDCKLIAEYDVVLTTFQNAANLHTLSAIYWWRIVVDEPQLNAGKFLGDHNHDWFAQHRWLLTGTPINATVESMDPSLDFLKLGTYDALYSHYPPVIAHVLKSFMVRYTKAGVLDGETNLQLPPVVPRTVKCDLSPIDQEWYRSLQTDQKNAFYGVMASCRADPDYVGEEDPQWEFSGRKVKVNKKILKIRGMLTKLRQAASSGLKQDTGEEEYDAGRGCYIKLKHWYQSKAEAVIEVLEGKDPEEKVLVFSEFPATLQAIKALLPSIGLQSRNLIGSSSAASRGKAIRDFQTDPPTKVFLLTYRAGGAGITLTAGTHIILCEPTLNPSFEKQAIGRSHRMGQTKPLTVTRMLMLGTIEEKVAEFVERQKSEVEGDPQQQLESTMMETNQAANDETNKLTIEELRDFIYKIPDEEDE